MAVLAEEIIMIVAMIEEVMMIVNITAAGLHTEGVVDGEVPKTEINFPGEDRHLLIIVEEDTDHVPGPALIHLVATEMNFQPQSWTWICEQLFVVNC